MDRSHLPLVVLGGDRAYLLGLLYGRHTQVAELASGLEGAASRAARPIVVTMTAPRTECPGLLAERLALLSLPRLEGVAARVPGQLVCLDADVDPGRPIDEAGMWAGLTCPVSELRQWRSLPPESGSDSVSTQAFKTYLQQAGVRTSYLLDTAQANDPGPVLKALARVPSVDACRAPMVVLVSEAPQVTWREALGRESRASAIRWIDLTPLVPTQPSDVELWLQTLAREAPALVRTPGLDGTVSRLRAAYASQPRQSMMSVHTLILDALDTAREAA